MKRLKPLSSRDLAISKGNMLRAVRALQTGGDAALDKELDRIFPGTKAKAARETTPATENNAPGLVN
jgi:hypothetical protein